MSVLYTVSNQVSCETKTRTLLNSTYPVDWTWINFHSIMEAPEKLLVLLHSPLHRKLVETSYLFVLLIQQLEKFDDIFLSFASFSFNDFRSLLSKAFTNVPLMGILREFFSMIHFSIASSRAGALENYWLHDSWFRWSKEFNSEADRRIRYILNWFGN